MFMKLFQNSFISTVKKNPQNNKNNKENPKQNKIKQKKYRWTE